MVGCMNCLRQALWNCTSCNAFFCEEDKVKHANGYKAHHFKQTGNKLDPEQGIALRANLLKKMKILDECSERIVEETRILISKIGNLCVQSIRRIEVKRQQYFQMFAMTQRSLNTLEIKDLEKEQEVILENCLETKEFKEIEEYFKQDCFKEDNFKNERVRKIEEEKKIFEEERLKFLTEQPRSSRNLEITEKYEREFKEILPQIEKYMTDLKNIKKMDANAIDSILTNKPNYKPAPNEKESEFKLIYGIIQESIRITENNNAELRNIKISPVPIPNINSLNERLESNIIPKLKESIESCKSFLVFLNSYKHRFNTENYKSIKISNTRDYYFFCN